MDYMHVPVLLDEAVKHLKVKPGGFYVDCTLGGGGYTLKISKLAGSEGKVFSFDLDPLAINNFKNKYKKFKNIELINDNFRNLQKIDARLYKTDNFLDGIIYDLGLSNAQLEDRKRGFSFKVDAPLNMCFGEGDGIVPTEEIVNKYSEKKLTEILYKYGEEKFANKIAKNIAEIRNREIIKTTFQLLQAVRSGIPEAVIRKRKIHFATKTFQALRIESNQELKNLEDSLKESLRLLAKGGRIVVVSYHSLEDRIVKRFFKDESIDCVCNPRVPICTCDKSAKIKILNKKPIVASENEIKENPKARSAKLRAAEKI